MTPFDRRVLTLALLTLLAACAGESSPPSSVESPVGSWSVVASATGPGGGVRAVIDDDISTGWTGPETPYWFEIDLGEQVQIDAVRILSGREAGADVRVNVGVHDNPGRQPGVFDRIGAGEWLLVPVGYEARFIRVSVDGADRAPIWLEVETMADGTS